MTNNVIILQDTEFEAEVLNSDQPVLLYFWATWCGPCKLVAPSVEKIASQYSDRLKVVKMEVDPNPETRKTYKVEGVPALRLIKNQQVVQSHEGVITEKLLKDWVEKGLEQ
ncbi:MAG: thioredoxin [Microcoleaceae cyanobacterium]